MDSIFSNRCYSRACEIARSVHGTEYADLPLPLQEAVFAKAVREEREKGLEELRGLNERGRVWQLSIIADRLKKGKD